jgi:hypothetical protein
MKLKLAIVVNGGNIQSVYTSRPDVSLQIDVIDFDNLKAEGYGNDQLDCILEARTGNLKLLEY